MVCAGELGVVYLNFLFLKTRLSCSLYSTNHGCCLTIHCSETNTALTDCNTALFDMQQETIT